MAIVLDEEDADLFEGKLFDSDRRPRISAATYLECSIVMDRKGTETARYRFAKLLELARVEYVPFTQAQAEVARLAHRRFGRGSGHPANLNFGDCFAYALAAETGEPLLCKGDDFRHTDLELA